LWASKRYYFCARNHLFCEL